MRRSVRYALSAVVGLGVMALTILVDSGGIGLVVMIPIIYGTTTALALDNVKLIRTLSGEGASRTVGILGGGIGAGTTASLFQQSLAAGIAGYGLFLFGMTLVVAEVNCRAVGNAPSLGPESGFATYVAVGSRHWRTPDCRCKRDGRGSPGP